MRISNSSGGFTLYEVIISITAVEIISGLLSVSLLTLLDRSEFINIADQFKDTLRQAKRLALTIRKSHRIKSDSGFLMLQKKVQKTFKQFHRKKYRLKSQSVPIAGHYSVHSGSHPADQSSSKMKTTAQEFL